MLPIREAKLRRLDTVEDIAPFLEWIKQDREVLAVDTETGGIGGKALEWYRPGFKCRLVQFGDVDTGWVLRADRFGIVIEEVLATYDRPIVGHNMASFDMHVLRETGFSTPPLHLINDTLMMSRILDSRGKHGLKEVASKLFGPMAGAGEKLLARAFELHGFGKDKGVGFSEIPYNTPAYDVYSAADVVLTARVYTEYWPQVRDQYYEAYIREMGAWNVTAEHEAQGMPVDLDRARALKEDYESRLVLLRAELKQLGIQNPNSKAQRLQALFAEGFEPEEFTESGEAKLDRAILENLASPTAMALIEYGRCEGWLTKYVDKVINDSFNGKVYPSFNPFGAKTGRQAAYGPPVQQLPGRHEEAYKIRQMFLPRENEELWSIDYDGQENRLAAHFSKDVALTRLILSGEDIHRYTASVVYGIPEDGITKDQRSLVKNVVYAEQYGAGIKKLMKMLNMPKDEVLRIKQGIADAYPQLSAWKNEVISQGKIRYMQEGAAYAHTWGGRRVYADQYDDVEPSYYTLPNYVLQGTGADILKEALNRIAAAGLSQYIYLPVHDELLFSLPKGRVGRELAEELARLMAFTTEFEIPITCSPDGPFHAWEPH